MAMVSLLLHCLDDCSCQDGRAPLAAPLKVEIHDASLAI